MFTWIESNPDLGRVDVCINNAGLSTAETLTEGSMDSWRKMLDVNVLGKTIVMNCIYCVLLNMSHVIKCNFLTLYDTCHMT